MIPKLALHWQILLGVAVGAAAGLALNAAAGERHSTTVLSPGKALVVEDTTDRIDVRVTDPAGKVLERYVVDPTGEEKGSYTTLSRLKEKQPQAYRLFQEHGRSTARHVGDVANDLGGLFLRLLKMVSVPLIITSLLTGVLGLADAGRFRRLFSLTLTYYVTTSAIAVFTGLLLVNMIQPGHRGAPAPPGAAADAPPARGLGEVLFGQVEKLIPVNPVEAVAGSDFLSTISFTLAFGVFAVLVGGRVLEVLRGLAEAGFKVMMAMTMAIIRLAPLGVLFLMLYATATQGARVFETLGWYMLTVFSGLALHGAVTLPLIVWLVARRRPLAYARALSPALLTAFSSASSNATLPLTMSCVEGRAGISNRVGSFVLPLGATVNMDGTALFEVVAVMFIAQLEPGIDLTIAQQVLIAFTALLASIGAAGIPHAGLVTMVIVLQAAGLPADRVGLILAVDRVLDMCRTAVNVWSDACGCAVVAYYDKGDGPAAAEPPAAGGGVAAG
jgi:Na+/H+-dicarboxylate symporter